MSGEVGVHLFIHLRNISCVPTRCKALFWVPTIEQNRQRLHFMDEETKSERLCSQFKVAQLERAEPGFRAMLQAQVLSLSPYCLGGKAGW